ncbi:MAG TPA: hypothetical protein PKL48_02690 [Thermodesulfobacteriota bacterium]|nr:hypothetical protein [Thermodesulfobacteriota bacterium]
MPEEDAAHRFTPFSAPSHMNKGSMLTLERIARVSCTLAEI